MKGQECELETQFQYLDTDSRQQDRTNVIGTNNAQFKTGCNNHSNNSTHESKHGIA